MVVLRIVICVVLGLAGGAATAFSLHTATAWIVAMAAFGALWGGLLAALGAYVLQPLALLGLVLDVSWSLLNTLTGLVWLVICLARGSLAAPTPASQRSGTLVISGAALTGAAASTLGNIIGGKWLAHEEVHVWQARIFGPLYWPIYLSSYAANMLARFLTFRFADPHWQSYGRVVMEDWAERSCPTTGRGANSGMVNWGWWILMFLMAALNAACVLAILNSLPWLHPPLPVLHMLLPAWVFGVIGLLLYAVIRSLLPAA